MNELISPVLRIGFLVIAFALSLILALCIFIFVRYGRTASITIPSSILAAAFFLIAIATAFSTLQNLIELYA